MSLTLGIDTSNYTTSLALYDTDSHEIRQEKLLLPVKPGEKGLRQSDAVFHHVQQLPQLMDRLWQAGGKESLCAIGASARPRDIQGSYMPCFTVGLTCGKLLSKALDAPLYTFSHQAGHIAAALYSSKSLSLLDKPFLAFHVSGGTTEALVVSPDPQRIFSCQLAAKTLDLNAGQLIDRVGVMLGLSFPAGPALEQLAFACKEERFKGIKPAMKGADCCLSGGENLCRKLMQEGSDPSYVAAFCLEYVKKALDQMCSHLLGQYGQVPVVFAGGVMSNSILRKYFTERYQAVFAEPPFSADNAAGISVLTAIKAGL